MATAAAVAGVFACGGSTTSPTAGSEDERGSVGVPPTAAEYCTNLGYKLEASQCNFPDGTSCEEWSFLRGGCGQSYSYCARHGGTISTVTEDAGTFTAVRGVCTLNGKQCDEGTFLQTGTCG
jgi:putative hemolysin